jgi:hypothetical protein
MAAVDEAEKCAVLHILQHDVQIAIFRDEHVQHLHNERVVKLVVDAQPAGETEIMASPAVASTVPTTESAVTALDAAGS